MAYTIQGFSIKDEQLFAHITVNNVQQQLLLPFSSNENLIHTYPQKYLQVNICHIIDSQGVGVYQARKFRPFLPLPEGSRECTQWEFDKHCFENPDSRYEVDINATVWQTFNERFNSF